MKTKIKALSIFWREKTCSRDAVSETPKLLWTHQFYVLFHNLLEGIWQFKVIYLSQSLDLGLIDWRRPLIWSSQSQEKFLIRFFDQPYFRRFKKTCSILSQVLLSHHIPLLSNLCWMKLYFYLRWHVFNSAKKENETIGRNTIRVGHVIGWPYFRRFKKLGGKYVKVPRANFNDCKDSLKSVFASQW